MGGMGSLHKKTSPPSARVAAMSDMQHRTSLKHLEHFIDTSLKHLWEHVKHFFFFEGGGVGPEMLILLCGWGGGSRSKILMYKI